MEKMFTELLSEDFCRLSDEGYTLTDVAPATPADGLPFGEVTYKVAFKNPTGISISYSVKVKATDVSYLMRCIGESPIEFLANTWKYIHKKVS